MQRQQVVQSNNQKRSSNQPAVSSHITPVSSLPSGWRRDETLKQSGLSSGKTEIYYIRYVIIVNFCIFVYNCIYFGKEFCIMLCVLINPSFCMKTSSAVYSLS